MNYLPFEIYSVLYARFLKRDSKELFEGIDLIGKSVLDLCCGSGRSGLEALKMGASSVLGVDSCEEMLDPNIKKIINFKKCSVEHYLFLPYRNTEDIIVCQQAINYWFFHVPVKEIYNTLNDGGYLIFNTFNTKPPTTPKITEYTINGTNYCEMYYMNDKTNVVYHSQGAEGYPIHTTEFWWISPERFKSNLEIYFDCTEIKKGSTSIWQCRKKKLLDILK